MNEASHIIDRDDPSAPAPLLAAAKALRRLAPSYNKFYIVGVEDARALTEAGALASQRSRFDSAFYALCGVCHTLFALTRVHDADCLDAFGQRHLKGPIHTERCVECTASGEWPALPPVPPVSERTPPRAAAAAGMGSVEAPAVVYAEVPGKRATRSAIPARKRVRWADGGASRQEVEDEGVAKTQVCWAKVVGFPWWPAVAATPVGCVSEVGAEAACAGSVFVRFYGTAESAWLTRAAVVPFAVGAPAPPTKQEEKRAKKFEAALREAKAAVAAETAGKKLKTVHREAIHPLAGASLKPDKIAPPPPEEEMAAHNRRCLQNNADRRAARWVDGVMRIALPADAAEAARRWFCAPSHRSQTGGWRLAGGAELHGYNNYPLTHAPVHDGAAQQLHTLVINPRDREDVLHPSRGIPGFAALVDAARELLPAQTADGRDLEFTHAHFLDQCHAIARFRDHQDTEEDGRAGESQEEEDRRVVYTVVTRLSAGGDATMQVVGNRKVRYGADAGSAILFRSELWHRTCDVPVEGVIKLTLFFGIFW